MGLFGSIGHFFSSAPKAIVKTITHPAKLATAIATGGASVVAPKVFKPVENVVGQLYNPQTALSALQLASPGGRAMDLATLLGGVNAVSNLQKVTSAVTPSLGGVANLVTAGASLAGTFLPKTTPMAPTQMAAAPKMLPALGTTAAAVGRRFAQKFPNLAAQIQKFRNLGYNKVTRGYLWNLLKRFGPEFIISVGILSAAAVTELMMAGPGRRRMNPANPKALRRAARRIKGFHRMCSHVDLLKSRGRSRTHTVYAGPQRCNTCRKSPCRC